MWVKMACASREFQDDDDNPPHQRLRLLQPVRGPQELREVVDVSGDMGILRSVAFLINRQRSPHQRLGIPRPVRGLQQWREVVEGCGDIEAEAIYVLYQFIVSRRPSARRTFGL